MLNCYKYQCRTYPEVGIDKTCSRCKSTKDLSRFAKDKKKPDGRFYICRECSTTQHTKGIRVPDIIKEGVFYRTCRRCEEEKSLDSFGNQPRGLNGKQRVCKNCNRLLAKERGHYTKEKRHAREASNPQAKIRRILRTRVVCALSKYKQKKITKAAKTLDMLGCDIVHFTQYLESLFELGMSWENHGAYKVGQSMTWHIDHIKPCEAFDLTDAKQQKACFHYTNLRPMWAVDNLKKSYNYVA